MSIPHDIETLKQDMHSLRTDHILLKERLKDIFEDMTELRLQNKQLLEFMYKFQGGSAWLFGMIAVAGTIGGLIVSFLTHFFPKAG